MLAGPPGRSLEAGHVRVGKADPAPGRQRGQDPVALGAAAVQVDRQVGRRAEPAHRTQFAGGQQAIDGAGPAGKRGQLGRCGQHDLVLREGPVQPAVDRDRGQEVTKPQRRERAW
jgi:hypothetical protein